MNKIWKGAVGRNMDPVTVEYDCRGKRATKQFDSAYEARRFYAEKMAEGRNPKVLKN